MGIGCDIQVHASDPEGHLENTIVYLDGQAIAAGAKEVWPVADRWGWLVRRVVDPYHHWDIGRSLTGCCSG